MSRQAEKAGFGQPDEASRSIFGHCQKDTGLIQTDDDRVSQDRQDSALFLAK